MANFLNLGKDLALAFIQGITEIFPVSSSGHLVTFSFVFDRPIALDLLSFFHLGTFLAILVRYRGDVTNLASGNYGWKLPANLFLSFLITGVVALLFRSLAVNLINGQASIVAYMWMINGIALLFVGLFAPQGSRRFNQLGLRDFLLIGFFQGMTVIPGISRLGFTLSIALMVGLIWTDAMRVSFLLSLPTILFANLYETLLHTGWLTELGILSTSGGTFSALKWPTSSGDIIAGGLILAASFVGGMLALYILSKYLTRKLLYYFGFYCLSAGLFFIPYLKLFQPN